MSIYATLWRLKFPRFGDDYRGCDWIEVTAQGVPAHIGSPTAGNGYEDEDPFAVFLPPPLETDEDGDNPYLRAVVFVTETTVKGTHRSRQEYEAPLLVLTGRQYAEMSFAALHMLLCDKLRGGRPRVNAQVFTSNGRSQVLYDDGTTGETSRN